MLGKPDDRELEEMSLHDMGAGNPALLYKIIQSWEKVYTKGTQPRKRNCVTRKPYQQLILERVKAIKLPFSIEISPRPASLEHVLVSLE